MSKSKEDELIEEIQWIAEKCNEKQHTIDCLEGLLKACRPYVERSYERTKYRKPSYIQAGKLLLEIEDMIGPVYISDENEVQDE